MQAIVIATWAAGEVTNLKPRNLPWFRDIERALEASKSSDPLENQSNQQIAAKFRATFQQASSIPRGESIVLSLPEKSFTTFLNFPVSVL